jgi:hypothetical protein
MLSHVCKHVILNPTNLLTSKNYLKKNYTGYRTRAFISRMVALSSTMVFGDSFHCTPISGFGYSFVGSQRNFPNPSTVSSSTLVTCPLFLLILRVK